jgi:cytochrome c5
MSPRLPVAAFVFAAMAPGELGASSGDDVVDARCAACHSTGLRGAPGIGDSVAWQGRAAKGLGALVRNSIDGVRWGMPARGGAPELTTAEIEGAVIEMLRRSGGPWGAASRDGGATAEGSRHQAVAAGMAVQLTLIPARMLRAYPPGSAERELLADAFDESGLYHVSVTLQDSATGAPVERARVEAHIRQAGFDSQLIALEPRSAIAPSSYGRFVRLAPGVPGVATLAIDAGRATQASFHLAVD